MSATEHARRPSSFLLALSSCAFAFNWLWEMAQMSAYVEMSGRSWWDTLRPCTVATFWDVGITFAVVGIGSLATGQFRWAMTGKWNVYATAALLGGACAAAIEWRTLASGRWSYTEYMPVVPLLEVGLWPLLQLSLLVPAALAIGVWWSSRR